MVRSRGRSEALGRVLCLGLRRGGPIRKCEWRKGQHTVELHPLSCATQGVVGWCNVFGCIRLPGERESLCLCSHIKRYAKGFIGEMPAPVQ